MISRNQDFAENGSIKNKRQVQSQYWMTISYTLFISCVTWVQTSEWNKVTGKLEVGSEVTAYGKKAGEPITMNSYWGTVTAILSLVGEEYKVTDKNGTKHHHNRSDLRHKKNHNIVYGHVSDDKVHGSYAMQHFTTNAQKIYQVARSSVCIPNQIMQPHILKPQINELFQSVVK